MLHCPKLFPRQSVHSRWLGLRGVRQFKVLAFETSADDTGVALVDGGSILSNVVVKQHAEHEEFRGIHPQIAIKAHDRNLPEALRQALAESRIGIVDVDGIAYTRGPGMPGCLSVGASAARALAAALNKPLVGVHHMASTILPSRQLRLSSFQQAHALTALYTSDPAPQYPFLTLLVSGGHTLLLLARSSFDFSILATTGDESIGNAFDRVANLLDVPWSNTRSAGASLEQFAQAANPGSDVHFSIPSPGKLIFSYSGLISGVRSYILKRSNPNMVIHLPETPSNSTLKHPPTPERALMRQRIRMTVAEMSLDERQGIAAAFQKAAIAQLEEKLKLGLKHCLKLGIHPTSVVVSGGVASNTRLRERLRAVLQDTGTQSEMPLIFPPPHLCTDNAAMIAWTALERFRSGSHDELTVQVRPIWSIEDLRTYSSR